MDKFRLTVQYTTHIDIEIESLDDPEIDSCVSSAMYFENYISEVLMDDGYVACDSAVWIEPIDAYIPVRISKERADKMIAWTPVDEEITDAESKQYWGYQDLKAMGYEIEGIE